jgi:CrcB protein
LVALGVGLLGGLGSVIRFAVYRAVVRTDPSDFPLGTFLVNACGAFLLGLLFGLHAAHEVMLVAGLGLLGGLTTFSTWMYESERLVVDGYAAGAVRNLVVSTVVGLAAVAAGVALGGLL